MSTIEVPNDDDKNFGGLETKLNITKGEKPPKVNLKNDYFYPNNNFVQYYVLKL